MIANYAVDGHPARLDGAAAARASRPPSCGATATAASSVIDEPDARASSRCGRGWPSMFRGYLHDEERYAKCFAGGWYLTGDLARRDADGYFWFVGRARRRHQVVRAPHRPVRGRERAARAPGGRRGGRHRQARSGRARGRQGVRRRSSPGYAPSDALARELLGFARKRLGRRRRAEGDRLPAVAPAHAERQDHAAPAQGARARAARGRHLDAGGRRHDAAEPSPDFLALDRDHALALLRRWCASAASRRSAPSSTAPGRSAASCTSTSARRRSRRA